MDQSIASIRKDYNKADLDVASVATNPIDQFKKWLTEAITAQVPEPTAMNLATINEGNRPSSRIVLLKGVNEKEEGFVFFTNYNSSKGRSIDFNAFACLTFFWPELERQIRIEGKTIKVNEQESDSYFYSRPTESQLGAWASPQSEVIENREVLKENIEKYKERFKEGIKRPPHWGGYMVCADKIEFWQGRPSRLHDRILYVNEKGNWRIVRLAP